MQSTLSAFAKRLREFIEDSLHVEKSEAQFNELALEVFALQLAHNPTYRRFCEARGVAPATHWSQIPAIPTSAFKELDMTSLAPENRSTTFHSSGTTGQKPSRHFHSSESLALYEGSLLPCFEHHLLADEPPEVTLLSLTPCASDAPNSSLAHMFESICKHYGNETSLFAGLLNSDGTWSINFKEGVEFLNRATSRTTPVLVVGTAFNFVHLIEHCRESGIRLSLPSGSRVLETGGYKGRTRIIPKSELHQMISECLGVALSHLITEYGMSELSSQAYDGILGEIKPRLFQFPPWARAQIISPETGQPVGVGETGLIRVFDLANVWSVMAIQTEDLATQRENGFELIGRAEATELRGCSLIAVDS